MHRRLGPGLALLWLTIAACGSDASPPPPGLPDAAPGDPDAAPDRAAPTTSASPPGGAVWEAPTVTLTTDEPATIYYSVDGSAPTMASSSGPSPLVVDGVSLSQPLRFFAVDAAGNAEPPRSEAYVQRRTATLSIADPAGTPTVTVVEQPGGLTLAATATAAGGRVTISLKLISHLSRRMFNAKALVTSSTEGTFVSSDGTLGGVPLRYFGPRALAPGGTVTRDLAFDGVTGATDPMLVELTLADAPMLYGGSSWAFGISAVDTSWSGVVSRLGCAGIRHAPLSGVGETPGCTLNSGALSADASKLYLSSRNLPRVIEIDTGTLAKTLSPSLSRIENSPNGIGATVGITRSPDDQYLYVVLYDNRHLFVGGARGLAGAPTVELVRLDRATLAEIDRVNLVTATDGVRSYPMEISPDGTRGAVPLRGLHQVALVDLTTMTVIDTDPATGGAQFLDLSGDPERSVRALAFSPDGASLFVPTRSGSATPIVKVDLTTFQRTETPLQVNGDVRVVAAAFAADGRLVVGRQQLGDVLGLLLYDPVLDLQTSFDIGRVSAMTLVDGGTRVLLQGDGTMSLFDLETEALVDIDSDPGNGLTFASGQSNGHAQILTPY